MSSFKPSCSNLSSFNIVVMCLHLTPIVVMCPYFTPVVGKCLHSIPAVVMGPHFTLVVGKCPLFTPVVVMCAHFTPIVVMCHLVLLLLLKWLKHQKYCSFSFVKGRFDLPGGTVRTFKICCVEIDRVTSLSTCKFWIGF